MRCNDFAIHIFHGYSFICNVAFILRRVSIKFELAIRFTIHVSLWHCFEMRVESRNGGVYNRPGHASQEVTSSITPDPGTVIEQRHAG